MDKYVWHIKESRKTSSGAAGGSGKVYQLTRKGLAIGRRPDADIVVLSKSVDAQQAVIEWNESSQQYMIRDLDSTNGTYINQFPLRGTSRLLEQRDSIRFGYCTDQVFRVDVQVVASGSNTTRSSSTQTAAAVQAPVQIVTQPSVIVSASSPQVVTVVSVSGVTPTTVVATSVPQIITTSDLSSSPAGAGAGTDTVYTTDKTVQTSVTRYNRSSSTSRIDGRKSVSPVTKGSSLYGNPSWWGGGQSENESDNQLLGSDTELSPRRVRSPPVLRDITANNREDESNNKLVHHLSPNPRTRSLSVTGTSPLSRTAEQDASRERRAASIESTSFTVEFDSEQPRRAKPPRGLTRQRPASFCGKLREPTSSLTPPTSPQRKGSLKKRSSSVRKPAPAVNTRLSQKATDTKRTASVNETIVKVKDGAPKKGKDGDTIKGDSESRDKTYTVEELDDKLSKLDTSTLFFHQSNPSPLRSQSDSVFNSQPTSVHSTPHQLTDSRPGSARKQWRNDNEIPHSLILASIEARLKRLADAANRTASNIQQFIGSLKEQDISSSVSSLIAPVTKAELPQWTVVNKEYDSICQYITASEESLKVIHTALGQMVSVETAADETDYHKQNNEQEVLCDSLEANSSSTSSNPLLLVTAECDSSPVNWREKEIEKSDSDLYYSASSEGDDD